MDLWRDGKELLAYGVHKLRCKTNMTIADTQQSESVTKRVPQDVVLGSITNRKVKFKKILRLGARQCVLYVYFQYFGDRN